MFPSLMARLRQLLPVPSKRDWLVLGIVAAAILVAWSLYPSRTAVAEAESKELITVWLMPQVIYREPYIDPIKEFERQNPQYRVQVGSAVSRSLGGDPTRFLLGVAGGMPPDVIFFDRFAIVEWAARGAFENLDPYLRRDIERGVENAIREEDFYDVTWEEAEYQGKQYAIPTSTDTRALYYSEPALQRAGLVYRASDPEVQRGERRVGEARPPRSWEELSRKLGHYRGRAEPDGSVQIESLARGAAINQDVPASAVPDLRAAGARPGDVVVLISGSEVFRGRIASVQGSDSLVIDLNREQRPGLDRLPFSGSVEIKVFDQNDYMSRLTRFDPDTGRLLQAAMIPLFGNSFLYMYGWLNGAQFLSDDGTEVMLDSHRVLDAVQWLVDAYDQMGGAREALVFQTSESASGSDPFITGKIAMIIESNQYVNNILGINPEMEFRVARAPQPQRRWEAGAEPIGWGGGFAFAIPSTAQNKEAGWELIRHLSSNEGYIEGFKTLERYAASSGMPYFPNLAARIEVNDFLWQEYVAENPQLTERHRDAFTLFMELLPHNRHRPVTPIGQKLWVQQRRSTEEALNHLYHVEEAMEHGADEVQEALDELLAPSEGTPIRWGPVLVGYGACLLLFFGTIILRGRHSHAGNPVQSRWSHGYVCAAPWLAGFVVFGVGPILFTILISFSSYDVLTPAKLIGWENYVELLGWERNPETGELEAQDPLFWKSLWNTVYMAFAVPLSIALGLGMALLLNSKVRGQSVFRTLFYLPAIVPSVATFVLWMWLLDPTSGGLNSVIRGLGITDDPPRWLSDPAWAKPSLIMMGLWGVGSGMIIWLAGLKDIPESLYEAARIDGASRWRQFIHVTLPMLSPYILFNVVLGFITVFQIFEAAFIMTAGGPSDSTLFYAYKLFNEAFRYLEMGRASAMAWILFLIVMSITLLQLWLSKRWVHYRG